MKERTLYKFNGNQQQLLMCSPYLFFAASMVLTWKSKQECQISVELAFSVRTFSLTQNLREKKIVARGQERIEEKSAIYIPLTQAGHWRCKLDLLLLPSTLSYHCHSQDCRWRRFGHYAYKAGGGEPDRPFHNFGASRQGDIGWLYVAIERFATYFEAPMFWKGRSGNKEKPSDIWRKNFSSPLSCKQSYTARKMHWKSGNGGGGRIEAWSEIGRRTRSLDSGNVAKKS